MAMVSIMQAPWIDMIDMGTTGIGMRATANSQVDKGPTLSIRWAAFRGSL